MTLDTYLRTQTDRCPDCGVHIETQAALHVGGCLPSAERARATGQAIATSAHADDAARVEAAIRQLAATGRPFSANDAREVHGVKGGVVGATFTRLNKAEVIRSVGDETSTDKGTHGHRIFKWIGTAA